VLDAVSAERLAHVLAGVAPSEPSVSVHDLNAAMREALRQFNASAGEPPR
jgi:hypothetical protein